MLWNTIFSVLRWKFPSKMFALNYSIVILYCVVFVVLSCWILGESQCDQDGWTVCEFHDTGPLEDSPYVVFVASYFGE